MTDQLPTDIDPFDYDWFEESDLSQNDICRFPDDPEPDASAGPRYGRETSGVEHRIWDVLYTVRDPELPISIVDLGLIYDVSVDDNTATVEWTLTYSGCPAKYLLHDEVQTAVETAVPDQMDVTVVHTHSPVWDVSMISHRGQSVLNEFGLGVIDPPVTPSDHDQ